MARSIPVLHARLGDDNGDLVSLCVDVFRLAAVPVVLLLNYSTGRHTASFRVSDFAMFQIGGLLTKIAILFVIFGYLPHLIIRKIRGRHAATQPE